MKFLYIIRHAKSNQSFFGNDFERPLNERGLKDAPEMAQRLLDKKIKIDAFISSPAVRAKTTAQLFAKKYNILTDEIVFLPALYHAPAPVFYQVVTQIPENISSAALFAHNPGITYFVSQLCPGVQIDNMPTCGVFAVKVESETWADFVTAKKEFLFFDYPKNGG
jgi:phosphohistidine phosphatase